MLNWFRSNGRWLCVLLLLPGARVLADAERMWFPPGAEIDADEMPLEASDPDGEPPAPISREAPEYPHGFVPRGVSGQVTVHFTIDTDGNIDELEVIEKHATGPGNRTRNVSQRLMDAHAHAFWNEVAEVMKHEWRFEPARLDGRAVPSDGQVTWIFETHRLGTARVFWSGYRISTDPMELPEQAAGN